MINYRFTSLEKSSNYWPCSRVCQSTQWMLRIHQLHSRNFHGIRFKSFTKYVCNHCRCHSSCRLHNFYFCHRKYVKKIALFNLMLRNDARAVSFRNARILKDKLRHVRFFLGANSKPVFRHICRCNRCTAVDLRHAFRNTSTQSNI